MHRTLGVIGGSGLYEMEGFERVEEKSVSTVFGEPSDVVISGWLGETQLLFLPRHGRAHRVPPHRINYRANILALKMLGAEQVVSVTAVGSMKESIHPGDIVLVDQFIDRTRGRPFTFFEDDGVVAHVELAEPTDRVLRTALHVAAAKVGARAHLGGTYVVIEGPQFSTRAESLLFRSWGVDVIGMTNLPEARLAREAELPYATMALVTDYDCWHESEESVSVDAVLATLRKNVGTAKEILRAVARELPDAAASPATSALKNAILTRPENVPRAAREKLRPLLHKYLP